MGRVGLVADSAYLTHDMGASHPECPDRLRAIHARLQASGTMAQLTEIAAAPASDAWIEQVHTRAYIQQLAAKAPESGYVSLDPDTTMCPGTVEAAYRAAGGALAAVDAVMAGTVDHAFCAVRPPGHHAEADRAMGFCFMNNVAIAAKYLQGRYGLERVLIVDWDVHHGNGTQHSFEADPSVFFFSTHQFPHYPGTGRTTETGVGEGRGTTLNVPLSGGQGDDEYVEIFRTVLTPAVEEFAPNCIVISAGFDAHRDDPLAGMNLTDDGYARLTSMVMNLAARHASGRVISCLEGGYHLQGLAESVDRHLVAMLEA